MKAIKINQYGGPEQLALTELDVPVPADGEVLIRVRAFGINRAETYMRKGAWGNVAPISGIECVGEVVRDTTGTHPEGTKVAAMMGGMGRIRNGSYAEYTCAPAANVVALKSDLGWSDLAAIPESYTAAWCSLYDCHHLTPGEVLLVRGGTSAFGQAAINIAVDCGAVVHATTRSEEKVPLLEELGVAKTLIEKSDLSTAVRQVYPDGIDCVLDLIGNTTVLDSLKMVKKGGRVVVAGFLGGSAPIQFDVLSSLPIGANLNFFASLLLGSKDYPLSRVPLQMLVNKAERGVYRAKPAKVFGFEQLPDAHRLMESNQANGKIVVTI